MLLIACSNLCVIGPDELGFRTRILLDRLATLTKFVVIS